MLNISTHPLHLELGEPAIYSDLFLATDYELLLKNWNLR